MNDRDSSAEQRTLWTTCVCLAIVTLTVYGRVLGHDFVNFDDDQYITAQPMVMNGFTLEGIRWSFVTSEMGNWHPLTWQSHMLDVTLFGTWAGGHHATNVMLHVLATLLLLFALREMSGQLGPSAFVAALFALHPLHVESVAWASERKDTLCAVFWMGTLLAYARYTRVPSLGRYGAVLLLFALGLMSKPMLITLPFVLLLLDFWPLKRIETLAENRKQGRRLVLEKVPLFLLALAAIVGALLAQKSAGALANSEMHSLGERLSNASVSYITYLAKTIYPTTLAAFYPYPAEGIALWKSAACTIVLAIISVLCWQLRRNRPYLLVGWFWYLGTLVPVIGIVQVGNQAMADRYTYLPLVGIFVMLAWAGVEIIVARPNRRILIQGLGAIIAVACSATSWLQIGHWKDSETLFRHALKVAPESSMAHNNLGIVLYERGDLDEAEFHIGRAVELAPGNLEAVNNWGAVLLATGRPAEAEGQFRKVLNFREGDASVHLNLAVALLNQGNQSDAIAAAREALRVDGEYSLAQRFLDEHGER